MAALLVTMNHVATGAIVGGAEDFEWDDYVRYSTINYAPGSRAAAFLSGGLNLHSAHHLRPVQTRLQQLETHHRLQAEGFKAPVVTYTFVEALKAHFAALAWLGAGGAADMIGVDEGTSVMSLAVSTDKDRRTSAPSSGRSRVPPAGRS